MSLLPSISGLFKRRQFEPEVILLAVGWYLRFSLSVKFQERYEKRHGKCVVGPFWGRFSMCFSS
jgi:hypothetical protein